MRRRRHLAAASLLMCSTFALGEIAPPAQQIPSPPAPGAPQQQPGNDPSAPNGIPGAPPTFAPGVGAGDDQPWAPRVIRLAGSVMAGHLVSKVDPVYPPDAKAVHANGIVKLSALIRKDGRIRNLAVISGPQVFQTAAVNAVKQWVYRPYTLNGQAVEVRTTVTVSFSLP